MKIKFIRRSFLLIMAILLLTVLHACSGENSESQPNILIVLGDDASRAFFGCSGSGFYTRTPSIDRLASEGMQFTQFYTANSMCAPCRHELYTGLMPSLTGMYDNGCKPNGDFANMKTLLGELGYNVGLTGKLHFDSKNPFDVIPGFPTGQLDPQEEWSFDGIRSYISQSLEEGKPFCVVLGSTNPHSPWESGKPEDIALEDVTVPPHMVDTKTTRKMIAELMAEIELLDQQLGQASAMLQELKLEDNTILIFLSEQGSSLPMAKLTGNNFGFHSACIVRWPGMLKGGSKSDVVAQYVDILPTLIEIAGGVPPESIDGESMLDVWLHNKKTHRKYAYTTFYTDYRRAINNADFRLIKTVPGRYKREFTVDPMFLPYWPEWEEAASTDPSAREKIDRISGGFRSYELYNISEDPFELNDLAKDPNYEKVLTEMKADFEKEYTKLDDDFEDFVSKPNRNK